MKLSFSVTQYVSLLMKVLLAAERLISSFGLKRGTKELSQMEHKSFADLCKSYYSYLHVKSGTVCP